LVIKWCDSFTGYCTL